MSKIIGIDLGTTNSAVAIMEAGEPKIIENTEGSRTTPSIIALSKTKERIVGTIAKRQAVTNPTNTIFQTKRFIGHKFDEKAVQKDLKSIPFDIKKASDGGVAITMGDKDYTPEELSAMILTKLKNDAEAKTGEKITEAIITVPAYFNDSQRKATKDAGKIAGLDVKRIINEPTAAALAYGFNKKKDEQIAVFDFGGGTFDISILEVGDDVVEVKSVDGDAHLGGKDIDQAIINYLGAEFKKDTGIDVLTDKLALQRLDEAAEKAKIELSTALETEVNIPFLTSGEAGPQHLLVKMTRTKLEELTQEFLDRAIMITKRAIESSPFKVEEIDEIILVGGQTRMPKMIEMVKDLFKKEPNRTINPDEVVALGAAIQGGVISGDVNDILLLDVIPLSLGIETMGGVATKLIDKNTTIPASKSQVFSTASDNQSAVDIHITQGERPMASDNKSLGKFILDGIPPAQRGVPQVEVTFDVDANGILNVKAKDKATNKEQSIRIEAGSGLSDEEVEKMQKDAEEHAEEDAKKKDLIEARNVAEQLVYSTEKTLKEAGDKVPAETADTIKSKVDAVNAVKDGEDVEVLKKATEELTEEAQKIYQFMQDAQKEAEAAGAESTEEKKDGDVRDAEFEEKSETDSKEEKKDDSSEDTKSDENK
jgi:molecular chaperone DnaK